jgi:hypothetical protein
MRVTVCEHLYFFFLMLIILCSRHQSANAACAETGTLSRFSIEAPRPPPACSRSLLKKESSTAPNDGTFLATLIEPGVTALGMDPSAEKFRKYYPEI